MFIPGQSNPYQGITSLITADNKLVTHNNGTPLPHMYPQFRNLTYEQQAQIVPPHLLHQLHNIPALRPAQSTGFPMQASQMTQPLPDTAANTKGAAQKVLNNPAKKTHSFTFKNHQINLKQSFGPFNAEGVAAPIKVEPASWTAIENLITKYLESSPHLIPVEATQVCGLGFTPDKTSFEVYYLKDGVLERASTKVDLADITIIELLAKKYPSLIIASVSPFTNYANDLRSGLLRNRANPLTSHIKMRASKDTLHSSASLRALHYETAERAEELAKDRDVWYTYSGKNSSNPREILSQAITGKGRIKFTDRKKPLSNDEVRILYDAPLRKGRHTQDLENNHLKNLATQFPLHFCVNANLGQIEGEKAPKTAHFTDVLISAKKRSFFFPKQENIFLLGNENNKLNVEGVNRTEAGNALVDAFMLQSERLKKAKQAFYGDRKKEIKISDPLQVEGLTLAQLRSALFIRMLAQLAVNQNSLRDDPKIVLQFDLADLDSNIRAKVLEEGQLIEQFIFCVLEFASLEERKVSFNRIFNEFIDAFLPNLLQP